MLSFAEAPTPWQCMLTVLRRHGVDPATVRIERTLPVAEAVAAFKAGRADFLETGQPFAEILLAEGAAHLAASMGEATGPLPFSSYMTTTGYLRTERDTLTRFTRALYRAQQWLARASAAEVAALIAPAFPDVAADVRVAVVARYLAQGTWAADPILRAPGYEYLQQILLDGGFIKRRHRYEDLIDTIDRAGRRQRRLSAVRSSDSAIVPTVPTITSHDQAKRSTPYSDSTSRARFTPAMTIMAMTLAVSLTGRRVSSPSRKTPRSEPEVTPAILNTVHSICPGTKANAQASTPSTMPKISTAARETAR